MLSHVRHSEKEQYLAIVADYSIQYVVMYTIDSYKLDHGPLAEMIYSGK